MAGEIQQAFWPTGKVVYAIMRSAVAAVVKVSDGSLVSYVTGNLANYVIALTEQGSSGFYVGDVPAGVVAGSYTFSCYERVGGSAAEGDTYAGSGVIDWSGSADVPLSSIAAAIAALPMSATKHMTVQTVAYIDRGAPVGNRGNRTVEIRTFSAITGAAVNADSTPTVSVSGSSSGSTNQSNLSAATNPATGVYRYTYHTQPDDDLEQMRFDASATIAGVVFTNSCYTLITAQDKVGYSLADGSFVTATFGTCDLTAAMKTSAQTAADAAITANSLILEIEGDTDALTAGVTVTTNNDKTGYSLANGSFVTATFGTCDFTAQMKAATLARVTLVDTVTTNSDMRGTDNAALAATALSTAQWTNARAGYLDNLNVGGAVASHADILAINQSASKHVLIQTVGQYERPESGTTIYTVEVRTFNASTGAAVNADSTPTITALGSISGNLSGNLGAVSNPATGVYRSSYTVANTDTLEQIRMDVSATIASATFTLSCYTQLLDQVAVTWNATNASNLTAIFNKLPVNNIADETLVLAAVGNPMQAGSTVVLTDASLTTAKLGTFVLAKTTNITGFNDIAASAVVSAGAITTSGGKVSGVILTDTVTTYTGNTPQTGDSFVRLGAPSGASVSADLAAIAVDVTDIEGDTGNILAIKTNTDLIPSIPTNPLLTNDNRLNHLDADISSRTKPADTQAAVTLVATTTNLTNLPSVPTDWLTAAGVKADAVTKIQAGLSVPGSPMTLTGAERLAMSDALLIRDWTATISAVGQPARRSLMSAGRKLANHIDTTTLAGNLTVMREDDVTVAYQQVIIVSASAELMTSVG